MIQFTYNDIEVGSRLVQEARFQASRTNVAQMRYMLANKQARPKGLAGLVPRYMAAVPRDPFRPDRPLVYRRRRLELASDPGARRWRTLEDEVMAVPFRPLWAGHLSLSNRQILPDQRAFRKAPTLASREGPGSWPARKAASARMPWITPRLR